MRKSGESFSSLPMAEIIYRAFHPILSPDVESSLSRVAALTDEMRRT